MKDSYVNFPPSRPVLEHLATALEEYGLMLSVYKDYNCGPNEKDQTDFSVALPSASKLVKSVHTIAHINSQARRPVVLVRRDFDARNVKRNLHVAQYLRLMAEWGDRLEEAGLPRVQLGTYLSLCTSWDHETDARTTPENVVAVMKLPLDVYDQRHVLQHGSALLPEMQQYSGMAPDVFFELFQVEEMRMKDQVYPMMKKRGLIGKIA